MHKYNNEVGCAVIDSKILHIDDHKFDCIETMPNLVIPICTYL